MGNFCPRKPIQNIPKEEKNPQLDPLESEPPSQTQIKDEKLTIEEDMPEEMKYAKKEILPEDNIFEEDSIIIVSEEVKVGIKNLGGTSYLSTVIQCLSNSKKLTDYFLYKYEAKNKNLEISNELYKAFKYLWNCNNNNNPFSINDLKSIINKNPFFIGKKTNDIKSLIAFILDKLNKELNEKEENDTEDYNYTIKNNPGIQLVQEKIYEIFEKYYNKNYNSIVSKLFYGTSEKKFKCQVCKTIKYSYDIFSFIEFPIEKIHQFLGNTNIDIFECFKFYKKEQFLTGENKVYCSKCKSKNDSYSTSSLFSIPNYLCIILNINEGNSYKYKINFNESIDLTDYIDKKNDEKNLIYNLYAVINHKGNDLKNDDYIAYCRHRINNNWYLYNDSVVSKCERKEDYLNGISYILFYQKA
jgi:ubiquitin C-terminal hydrolase